MATDTLTLTDGAVVFACSRSARIAVPPANLFTTSSGLDGGLGVSSKKTDRLGDGVSQSGWRRPGREITVGGIFFAADEAGSRAFITMLDGLGADGRLMRLERHAGPDVRWCDARLDGDPKVTAVVEDDFGRVEWELPLYAPDPHLYGQERTVQATTPGDGYGLVWPLFGAGALDWGVNGPGGSGTLWNAGTVDAWPTVTVVGNAASGFVLGDGLGHEVVYRGAVTVQAPVTVDFAAGSAVQSGSDRGELLTGRGWWRVPANGGRVAPSVRSLQVGASCRANFVCYDTYY